MPASFITSFTDFTTASQLAWVPSSKNTVMVCLLPTFGLLVTSNSITWSAPFLNTRSPSFSVMSFSGPISITPFCMTISCSSTRALTSGTSARTSFTGAPV